MGCRAQILVYNNVVVTVIADPYPILELRGLTIPHHHCRVIDAFLGGRLATTTVAEATRESYFDTSTPKTCRLPVFPFLSDGIPTVMPDSASHAE